MFIYIPASAAVTVWRRRTIDDVLGRRGAPAPTHLPAAHARNARRSQSPLSRERDRACTIFGASRNTVRAFIRDLSYVATGLHSGEALRLLHPKGGLVIQPHPQPAQYCQYCGNFVFGARTSQSKQNKLNLLCWACWAHRGHCSSIDKKG